MPTCDPMDMIHVYIGPTVVALQCQCGMRWAEDNLTANRTLRTPAGCRAVALSELVRRAQVHVRKAHTPSAESACRTEDEAR